MRRKVKQDVALIPLALIWLNFVVFQISSVTAASWSYPLQGARILVGMEDFVDACAEFLSSDEVAGDGLISQSDFADFVLLSCISENLCEPDQQLEYNQLSVQLQLSFVFWICGDVSFDERVQCVRDLEATGGEFGYVVNEETADLVEEEILDICSSAYALVVDSGLAAETTGPTVSPSMATATPSAAPVEPLSMSPTSPTRLEPPVGKTGASAPTDLGPTSTTGTDDDLGGGAIAGIALAATAFVIAVALFARRRRHSEHRDKDIVPIAVHGDESIMTEDSRALKFVPIDSAQKELLVDVESLNRSSKGGASRSGSSAPIWGLMAGGGRSQESETSSQKSFSDLESRSGDQRWLGRASGDKKGPSSGPQIKGMELLAGSAGVRTAKPKVQSIAQFDPSTAAGIALYRKGDDEDHSKGRRVSTPVSFSDKVKTLESAISAADWEVVAALASVLADSDDLSSLSGSVGEIARRSTIGSGRSSSSADASFRTPRTHLTSEDQARAMNLDQLVEKGEWSAVASYATAYSKEKKAETDSELGSISTSHSVCTGEGSTQRRSLMDIVLGRRSGASDAAATAVDGGSAGDSVVSGNGRVGAAPRNEELHLMMLGRANTNETDPSSEDAASPKKSRTPEINPEPTQLDIPMAAAATGGTVAVSAASKKKGKWGRLFSRRSAPSNGAADQSDERGTEVFRLDVSSSDEQPGQDLHAGSPFETDFSRGLSSSNRSHDGSQFSGQSLRAQLDDAVANADWAAVEYLSAQLETMYKNPHSARSFTSISDNGELNSTFGDSLMVGSRLSSPTNSKDSEDNVMGLVSRSTKLAKARAQSMDGLDGASLRMELDRAVDRSDWTTVEDMCADILGRGGPPGDRSQPILLTDKDKVGSGKSITPSGELPSLSPARLPSVASSPNKDASSQLSSTHSAVSTYERDKVAKLGLLVEAGDWKGVNVLAGLFELESSGSLPPYSPQHTMSDSVDVEESNPYIQTWLGAATQLDHWGLNLDDAPITQRAESPAPSSSTASVVEPHTLLEFERLVNSKDWSGLAAFARAEDEIDDEDEQALERQLFNEEGQVLDERIDQDPLKTDNTKGSASEIDNPPTSPLVFK